MPTKHLFAIALSCIAPLACNPTQLPSQVGRVERAIAGDSVGTHVSFCDEIAQCMVGNDAPVCSIAYAAQGATEQLTVVDESRVVLTYAEEPVSLLGRGGLSVLEPITLDSHTAAALGLPAGTMVQSQFAPLTADHDGHLVNVELSVGAVDLPPRDPENFEPQFLVACCPQGCSAHACSNCAGGNSSNNYQGSWCCTNSNHYNACVYGPL